MHQQASNSFVAQFAFNIQNPGAFVVIRRSGTESILVEQVVDERSSDDPRQQLKVNGISINFI